MEYRELLRLYKEGKLDDQTREEVAKDIEKQDAISEYLFDNASDDGWDPAGMTGNEEGKEETTEKDRNFSREIRRSVRRAFVRMGLIVTAAVLCVVAFCLYVLPSISDRLWYDPGKIVDQATQTNRMSLDMKVFTELTMPYAERELVTVNRNGFGNYDITIPQTMKYGGAAWHSVSGNIRKGKLTLYDANIFTKPFDNTFEWCQLDGDLSKPLTELIPETDRNAREQSGDDEGTLLHGAAEGPEGTEQSIAQLKDDRLYRADFSLNRMMSYDEFLEFCGSDSGFAEIWCAVKYFDSCAYMGPSPVGFDMYVTHSSSLGWDREKYPSLIVWETGAEPDAVPEILTAEQMKPHLVSMLRYMDDQKDFRKMMDTDQDFASIADYIEQNGITIYGFSALTDRKTASEWFEKEEIYSVAFSEYR